MRCTGICIALTVICLGAILIGHHHGNLAFSVEHSHVAVPSLIVPVDPTTVNQGKGISSSPRCAHR